MSIISSLFLLVSSIMAIGNIASWFSHLSCFVVKSRQSQNKGFSTFPDDILINILSRLPTDSILRCRQVCTRWRTLTSSNYFITVQNQRAPSVVLVQKTPFDFYVYDALAKKLRKISFKSKFKFQIEGHAEELRCISLQSASGPLLHIRAQAYYNLSWHEHDFAFNLITRQLRVMNKAGRDTMCGLFFNESRNEYNYLCEVWTDASNKKGVQFYVYNVSSRSEGEIACSPFICGHLSNRHPVIVNQALYLMVHPIEEHVNHCMHVVLVFEMDSEKFYTLPYPEIECCIVHRSSVLFVHDGHLRY